jgi:hypothetical protein
MAPATTSAPYSDNHPEDAERAAGRVCRPLSMVTDHLMVLQQLTADQRLVSPLLLKFASVCGGSAKSTE